MDYTETIYAIWRKADHNKFIERFYQNFFKNYPQYERMFCCDMERQQTKVLQTLNFIFNSLDHMDQLQECFDYVKEVHEKFNLSKEDYQNFNNNLILSLKESLPDEEPMSSKEEEAWREVLKLITEKIS